MAHVAGFPQELRSIYTESSELGAGGMGIVYKARRSEPERVEVVKVMTGNPTPEACARFAREVRSAQSYRGRHVPEIYGVGPGPLCWYAMEFLEGGSLQDALQNGQIRLWDALDYIMQACRGLAKAHALGNTHRDLKPANLLLSKDKRTLKVTDWGITKMVTDADGQDLATLTDAGKLLGTISYMAPEQLKGAPCPASDVWALGIMLVRLATGKLVTFPGPGRDLLAKITCVVEFERDISNNGIEVALSGRGVDQKNWPVELRQLMSRWLQPDSHQRIQNSTVLLNEMQSLLPGGWQTALTDLADASSNAEKFRIEIAHKDELVQANNKAAEAARLTHLRELNQLNQREASLKVELAQKAALEEVRKHEIDDAKRSVAALSAELTRTNEASRRAVEAAELARKAELDAANHRAAALAAELARKKEHHEASRQAAEESANARKREVDEANQRIAALDAEIKRRNEHEEANRKAAEVVKSAHVRELEEARRSLRMSPVALLSIMLASALAVVVAIKISLPAPRLESARAETTESPKQDPPKQDLPKQDLLEEDPQKQDPTKQDPTKQDPTKQDPTKQDPTKQDPTKQDPAKQDPPKQPKQDPTKQDPPKQDPPKQDPPKQDPPKQDPPKQDPPKQDPPKQDPPKQDPPKPPTQLAAGEACKINRNCSSGYCKDQKCQ